MIDAEGMLDLHARVQKMAEYYSARFKRPGVDKPGGKRILNKLTRGIGFVTKLGVRIARDVGQIVEVTHEQFSVLEDLEINQRMVIKGTAGSGKTL